MRTLAVLVSFLLLASSLGAQLERRYHLTLERTLSGGPPYYTLPFLLSDLIPRHDRRFTEFSGDLSGRYIGALALVAAQTGREFPALERLVEDAIRQQKPDGHFGDPMTAGTRVTDADMARMWGNGRLLIGLMEYHAWRPNPRVLDAARRLGDFLLREAPRFNSAATLSVFSGPQAATGYICWTQNIEGLVALYRATGNARYRDLAAQMATHTFHYPGVHTHGLLSSLRGVLALAEATGDRRYVEQARDAAAAMIRSGDLFDSGAVREVASASWVRDEGCSDADWLRLQLLLWKMTGDRQHLEQAESAFFNAFSFNQFPTGDFGHRSFTRSGSNYASARAWWCCTLHGLRTFPELAAAVFRVAGNRVFYDLPLDGRADSAGANIVAASFLERDGTVRLRIERASDLAVAVRKPSWADAISASLNGRAVIGESDGAYLVFNRKWNTGDVLEITYGMTLSRRAGRGGLVQFAYGPWLLGVDEAHSPSFFDEPFSTRRLLADPRNEEGLSAPGAHEADAPAGDAPFAVAVARRVLQFSPGGYEAQPGAALLRPIAENAGQALPGRWEFAFRTGEPMPSGRTRRSPWTWPAAAAAFAMLGLLAAGRYLKTRRAAAAK